MDTRVTALARNLLDYSVSLQPGDKLLIEGETGCEELVRGLIAGAYARGAEPFFELSDPTLRRAQLLGATREQLDLEMRWRLARVKEMDARIYILAGDNLFEFADVPAEAMQAYELARKPVLDEGCRKKWVLLRFPTAAAAQGAGMSTDAFEDFCYRVSALDYSRMDRAMDPLVELMERTDRVEIRGPGTDLSFSIKGIPVVKCAGRVNVPDGEVFTAPVKDSVNGVITYNTLSVYDGVTCEAVSLIFEQGRIVKATGTPQEKIDAIFDTDEGARYVGEFALSVNPYIEKPMLDILYDEKIRGSLHFTPGDAYEDMADNGNRSAVHWDLVLIQTPEWGGGEIWFDGVLVRKDGVFVLSELEGLNPENLA
ncbi:MAG: aminopeptidase [Actinobacteria bacterium]|nr:aminopeptidase [Actinomycetota bacterium]